MAETLTAQQVLEGVALGTDVEHDLTIPTRMVGARLPIIFRRFKSFPNPSCLQLLQLVLDRLAEVPGCIAVVVGHSDAFGGDPENETLCKARAEAVAALLAGDANFFLGRFKAGGSDQWGLMEAIDMMTAVDADPDFPPALALGDTEIARFKRGQGLPASKALDQATLERAVTQYLQLLGPERPASKHLFPLAGGSGLPLTAIAGSEQVSEDPTAEFFVHPRGAEVFIFEGLVSPTIESFESGGDERKATFEKWCTECAQLIEGETGTLQVRLKDTAGNPLVGESVELIDESGEPVDEGAPRVGSAVTDASGVADFSTRVGMFTVSLPGRGLADETILRARRGFLNKFELDGVVPTEEG